MVRARTLDRQTFFEILYFLSTYPKDSTKEELVNENMTNAKNCFCLYLFSPLVLCEKDGIRYFCLICSNNEYMSFARISLRAQTLYPKTGVLHPPCWVVKFGLINCQNEKEKKDKLE